MVFDPRRKLVLLAIASIVAVGCAKDGPSFSTDTFAPPAARPLDVTQVSYEEPASEDLLSTFAPNSIARRQTPQPREMSVDEAVQIALSRSRVLRDLGGTVLRSPQTVPTIHEPAIRESDPRFGVEAALAAFDAQFSTQAVFEKNDRALNNRFLGGGTTLLTQDIMDFQTQIAKRAATGTEFTLRHLTDYDSNNATGNIFPSAWNTMIEGEFRQPLFRGAGVEYNRIAGPGAVVGLFNGVVIARVDTEVSLAEFEMGLRDLVSNVENAYWDLYYAYRYLDAQRRARDQALETWRTVSKKDVRASKVAQAHQQYLRLKQHVQNALTGRQIEGTRTNNGSSGGTFRATPGVYLAERRLRLVMGLPINDGAIIRPSDEPTLARIVFDWEEVGLEAMARRSELRRQQLRVRRRELELIASRNFLLPQVDATGRYRFRGFGQELLDPHRDALDRFDNAYQNLTGGEFQEWQLGVEVTVPLGFRRAHAAVRYAQLNLARERAVLLAQQENVVHDLSAAVSELDRAYEVAKTAYDLRQAADRELRAVRYAFQGGRSTVEAILDAQTRFVDAETNYYSATVDYALAIKNVNYEKGSLLDYNRVYLAGSPSQGAPAARRGYRAKKRHRWPMNYLFGDAASASPRDERARAGEQQTAEALPQGGRDATNPLGEQPAAESSAGIASPPRAPTGNSDRRSPAEHRFHPSADTRSADAAREPRDADATTRDRVAERGQASQGQQAPGRQVAPRSADPKPSGDPRVTLPEPVHGRTPYRRPAPGVRRLPEHPPPVRLPSRQ